MESSLVSFVLDFIGQSTLLVILLFFLLVGILWWFQSSGDTLPPGPPAFPIVGSLPFLGTDIREPLRQFSKKYGDVFTVYLGQRPVVVLNSYEAIREAFVKNGQAFSGRPQDLFLGEEITTGMGRSFLLSFEHPNQALQHLC